MRRGIDEHRVKKQPFAFAIVYIKCFRTYSVYLSFRHGVLILYTPCHLPPQREARALPRRAQIFPPHFRQRGARRTLRKAAEPRLARREVRPSDSVRFIFLCSPRYRAVWRRAEPPRKPQSWRGCLCRRARRGASFRGTKTPRRSTQTRRSLWRGCFSAPFW